MRPLALLFPVLLSATSLLAQPDPVASPWEGQSLPNIRPGDARIREVLVDIHARSATFREIVRRIETSSVVVFVRSGRCAERVRACLHVLGGQGPARTLRITVDIFSTGGAPLAGLFGHELQHAAEIVAEASVRDAASLEAFYASHGRRTSAGFETDQARIVERQVEREVSRRRVTGVRWR